VKPIIVIPPDLMSAADIDVLRQNDLCVVVASDPSKVRFIDPIPSQSSRTEIENAAIGLSRKLLNRQWGNYTAENVVGQATIARMFVDVLTAGTPLDRNGTREEQEQSFIDDARVDELRRIGREEARAERAAKKAATESAKAAEKAKGK
jgi:hypothetical protein